MTIKKELLKAIQDQRSESKKKEKFKGNLLDYIELVQQDPSIVKSMSKAMIRRGPDADGLVSMSNAVPQIKAQWGRSETSFGCAEGSL